MSQAKQNEEEKKQQKLNHSKPPSASRPNIDAITKNKLQEQPKQQVKQHYHSAGSKLSKFLKLQPNARAV